VKGNRNKHDEILSKCRGGRKWRMGRRARYGATITFEEVTFVLAILSNITNVIFLARRLAINFVLNCWHPPKTIRCLIFESLYIKRANNDNTFKRRVVNQHITMK
jgi:hypothetical protein